MLKPIHLSTDGGALLLQVFEPAAPSGQCVVHCPAFAEEMNKSRPMVARQARALARRGYRVVVPDLYGTGDSSGDFGEADWSRWLRDMRQVLQWVSQQDTAGLHLWGLRSGCLLALQCCGEFTTRSLTLWQPVTSGKAFLTQFLRLRMASGLRSESGETAASLRQRLAAGEPLEVAGYRLSPALASELESLEAAALLPPTGVTTHWLELSASAREGLTPGARRVVDAWCENGVDVSCHNVTGPGFWNTAEIALAGELLQTTEALFPQGSPQPSEPAPPQSQPGPLPERPLVFDCAGSELMGILHAGDEQARTGLLLVVGGPQYRVGSHRQFLLLARDAARQGIPTLRFDYRGMGDSDGELVGFEAIDGDIRCAIDAFCAARPGLERVVLWGLCDAATATSFYLGSDDRVAGAVLLNPWVHSEAGAAKAYLKGYYLQRLFSGAFWRKLFSGQFEAGESLRSLTDKLSKARRSSAPGADRSGNDSASGSGDLVQRMLQGLRAYRGRLLLVISGDDLTAREFLDGAAASKPFTRLLRDARCQRQTLEDADHTFSRAAWRDQVSAWTLQWIRSL